MPKRADGGVLRSRFVVPPFSQLDAKQGPWQARKKEWECMFNSGAGRDTTLLSKGRTLGLGVLQKADGSIQGTSIFDPVLMEALVRWFAPRPSIVRTRPVVVIDPFAGGCVRGIVASCFHLLYIGIDVSSRQVEANREQWRQAKAASPELEDVRYPPRWVHGDAEDIQALYTQALRDAKLDPSTPADFMVTCPPYFDLEQYNAGPNDLSMLPSYDAFLAKYTRIIANAAALLRQKHLAVFVVGNVRDKKTGGLHVMHKDTLAAFEKAGCTAYNDAVLLTALGTAPQRADKTMSAASKLVPTHQNVLVVVKGDGLTPAEAKACGIRAREDSQSESQ